MATKQKYCRRPHTHGTVIDAELWKLHMLGTGDEGVTPKEKTHLVYHFVIISCLLIDMNITFSNSFTQVWLHRTMVGT